MTEAQANPRSVLFVCNQNAIRSPMAKALLDKYSKRRIYADSVGLTTGFPDMFVSEVVKEIGGPQLDCHTPKTLQGIKLDDYELVVALSLPAYERLTGTMQDRPEALEYWETPDPGDREGTRDRIIDAYRLVRDHIEGRLADRFHFD